MGAVLVVASLAVVETTVALVAPALAPTDADWAAITAAATRVQATSLKIKDFSKGAEFDALAMKLNQQATELSNSYASKDATAANTALANMKATCKECHKKYR